MKRTLLLSFVICLFTTGIASADTFGTGGNEFNIDFVPISGDASSANGTSICYDPPHYPTYRAFNDPVNFRIGTYEISNDQFAKYAANNPYWTGGSVPANRTSWYEAAQFVNFLNTSTGNQAAYNFSGSTFSKWDAANAWGGDQSLQA